MKTRKTICIMIVSIFLINVFSFSSGAYYSVGDVNGDGSISAIDALMVLQHSVSSTSLSIPAQQCADVNGDGKINSADALQILRYSVNQITSFPNQSAVKIKVTAPSISKDSNGNGILKFTVSDKFSEIGTSIKKVTITSTSGKVYSIDSENLFMTIVGNTTVLTLYFKNFSPTAGETYTVRVVQDSFRNSSGKYNEAFSFTC